MSDGTERVPEHLRGAPGAEPRGVAGGEIAPEGTFRVPTASAERGGGVGLESGRPGGTLGTLKPGTKLLDVYTVEWTLHPHETERPGVFRCRTPFDDTVIVKVGAAHHPPDVALWRRLPDLDHPAVLRTLRIEEKDGLYYEVQEYCSGGSVREALASGLIASSLAASSSGDSIHNVPDWIERRFVPGVHEGLKYLHGRGIVHRDIKPANVYVRRGVNGTSCVIGDFDISSVLESDQTSRGTVRADATWRYSAPETLPFFQFQTGHVTATVARSADYYSLGVTIIELLLGTTGLPGSQAELFHFYTTGRRVALPQGPERLVTLLSGLLILDRELRWGAEEVDRWVAGATSGEDWLKIEKDGRRRFGSSGGATLRFGDDVAFDLPSLAEAMARHPEEAKRDLLRGSLATWIYDHDSNVGRAVEDDVDALKDDPEALLFRTIQRCDPARPFVLPDGRKASTPAEWVREAVAGKTMVGSTVDANLARLAHWLELKSQPDPELAGRVDAIAATSTKTRFEELAYAFDARLPYYADRPLAEAYGRRDVEGFRTPAEIVEAAFGAPESWEAGTPLSFTRGVGRWRDGFLAAWLRQRGFAAKAEAGEAAAKGVNRDDAGYDAFLRQLHPVPPCELTFDPAFEKGPLTAPYGRFRRAELPYVARGIGFPVGAVAFDGDAPGLRVDDLQIERRRGAVRITLDARADLPAGYAVQEARLVAVGGNLSIAGGSVPIRYRVIRPTGMAASRILLGMASGGVLMGGGRLAAQLFLPHPVRYADLDLYRLWTTTTGGDLSGGGRFFGAFAIVLLALVASFYATLALWRESQG